jgi:hypothetical protein
MSSPRVDIYVGPEKKHYSVPKEIICSQSDYFKRCFNGGFKEAEEQKLYLDEDKVEDFEILLEYVLCGQVTTQIRNEYQTSTSYLKCFEFIAYADKYGLGEAGIAVHDALRDLLQWDPHPLRPEHIELVFRATSKHHPIRDLIAKTALKRVVENSTLKKLADEHDAFAADILRMLLAASTKQAVKNPLEQAIRNI